MQRAEEALAEWQNQWDHHSKQYSDALQTQSVESTRSEQLESRLQSFSDRRKKIAEAQDEASPEDLQARFAEITEQELWKRQARDEFDRHLTDVADKIRKLREQDQKLTSLVDERHSTMQDARGKYASLEALQKAALGEGTQEDWRGLG